MIDRYKYLDLLPCNTYELKSMGYQDLIFSKPASICGLSLSSLSLSGSSGINLNPTEYAIAMANEAKKARYPAPDPTQMLPFKPVRNARN